MAYSGIHNIKAIEKTIAEATEGMITDRDDQVIGGYKEFIRPLKAKGFYDTAEQKILAHPAITEIVDDRPNALLISNGDGTARSFSTLTFNGDSLKATSYFGSGIGLTQLQATELVGKIPLDNLNFGQGLLSRNNELNINTGLGIEINNNKVSFKYGATAGLDVSSDGVRVDPSCAPQKRAVGSEDRLLVSDSNNGNSLKNISVKHFARYFQNTLRFTRPGGETTQLQFNNGGRFDGNPHLTFGGDTLSTTNLYLAGHLQVGNTLIKKDRIMVSTPTTPVDNATIPNGAFSLYLDEDNDKLMLRVKYSTGIVRNVSIDLIKRALVQEEDDETENQGFLLDDESADDDIGLNDPEETEGDSFAEMETAVTETTNQSSGGILGYFKSAFTKK